MNELTKYKELAKLIEQMINDKVQLIHGGQIFNWNDTKTPHIIQEIKKDDKNNDKYATFPRNDN
jgi:hypothetical protein